MSDPKSDELEARLRHFRAADEALRLTDQEKDIYAHHLRELAHGGYRHADGSVSTVFAETVPVDESRPDGEQYLIPRVHHGAIVLHEEAAELAAARGLESHPRYSSPAAAEERYRRIHEYMDRDVGDRAAAGIRGRAAPEPVASAPTPLMDQE